MTVTFFQETNGQPGLQTGTGGDLAFTPVAGGSNSIALDTSNVTGAFTFYAQVTDASGAASPAGTSAPSVTVSILPPGGSTPTITGLSASPNPVVSGDMLALTVNGVSDPGGTVHRVVYYQETNGQPGLQTGINGDFSFTPVLAIQGPGFPLLLDTSGAAGSFTFYAQAIDSQGNVSPDGTAAPAVTVTVESGSPPTAPSGLTATPVSPTEVDLTFSEASGTADGYTIERSQESTFVTFTRVFTINRPNTTTYNDVGLAPGTRYFYRVQAFNLAGNSAFSEVANAQTLGGAAPMGPLDGRYVNQLFSDLLGRPASAQDVAGFSTMLDQGAAADALPLLILNSDEYRSNGIQGFFSNVLHRSADPNEVNAFLSQLAAGATDEQLAATIYGSDEYNALHGATTQGFLSGLFADALARPLDAAGLAAFGPALESGQMTRTQVAMAVLTSPEVRARQVTAWYQQLLRRDPDSGGLAAFSGVLAGGGRDEDVVASLASSHEYFATRLGAVGTLNESFLDQAYRDLLGRPVDTAGLAAFGLALDARPDPAGRQAVVERIDTSSEYRANLVQGYYQRFLGRSASAGELDVWTAALANGATDETVMAAFAGSNEYYVKHGATNANFLLAAYSDLVGQPANIQSPEYLNLRAALNNGTMSPGGVAKTLLSKQTYRDDLVSGLYQGLLRRPADSGGQAAFSNQLIAGATDENVIAELISSPEYYHNVAG